MARGSPHAFCSGRTQMAIACCRCSFGPLRRVETSVERSDARACRGAREGGRASRCHSSSGIRLEMPWGRLAYVGARVESVDASPTESLPLVHSLPIASSMATCSRAGHLGERISSVSKRVAASATAVDLVAGAAHRYLLESGVRRGEEGRGGEGRG